MEIRSANMRTAHGLRCNDGSQMSVSASRCIEEYHADHHFVRESGSGMDAPESLPTGSLKAFFVESSINAGAVRFAGICQRTTTRD
jgi:hypothetical protein